MGALLTRDFFEKPAETIARELLGARLVRALDDRRESYVITETEAYVGPHDLACHASKGRTKRTEVMFGPPGHWYVYFCYGVHWMLNIVVRERDFPAAVLIRGVEGVSGPGRLTKKMAITGALNGMPSAPESGLWIEARDGRVPRHERTPRIGIGYAKEWRDKRLRFVIKDTQKG
jgi:DNA-3-methyladenine glycosylase